eukprot:SAG11_NODE_74_length_18043_cov_13.387818_20_plen_174_part_00
MRVSSTKESAMVRASSLHRTTTFSRVCVFQRVLHRPTSCQCVAQIENLAGALIACLLARPGDRSGTFVHNQRTGPGKGVWPDGTTFEGNFVDGKRTGEGKLSNTDGTVYTLQFESDKVVDGTGSVTWKDGSKYEGQISVNGESFHRHGKGTFLGRQCQHGAHANHAVSWCLLQ